MIGQAAAAFVEHGDMIFVDSGTTTLEMLPYLKEKRITVVTNNVDFITQAMPYEHLTIFSTGGMLERKQILSLVIKVLNVSKHTMSIKHLLHQRVYPLIMASRIPPRLRQILKTLVEKRQNLLLVDDSKFDHYALTTFCDLKDIDIVVTNEQPNEDYLQYGKEHDVKFVTP